MSRSKGVILYMLTFKLGQTELFVMCVRIKRVYVEWGSTVLRSAVLYFPLTTQIAPQLL